MQIRTEDIFEFLKKQAIPYQVVGLPQTEYTLASLLHPISKAFYFVVDVSLVPDVTDSLFMVNEPIGENPNAQIVLSSDDPQKIYYRLTAHYFSQKSSGNISNLAVIHPEAAIGKNVQIDPFSALGKCKIGEGSIIGSHVTIHDNCTIGKNVFIDSNSVIGAMGMAWVWDEGGKEKIKQPQLGGVEIGDNCVLGSQTVVVRGSINENTQIGKGSLLAPGCRLGHGTILKENVHFANGVLTGGNSKVGADSFIGSGAILRPGISLHENTIAGAGSVVVKDTTTSGLTLMGNPAKEFERKAKPSGMPKPKKI